MSASSDDDVLARSVRALRREQVLTVTPVAPIGDDAVWGREHTWSRIAADVRRARTVRRWISMGALQLALGLCAATVWGAATGRLRPAARAATSALRDLVAHVPHAHPVPRRSPISARDVASPGLGCPLAPAPTLAAEPPLAPAPAPTLVAEAPLVKTPPTSSRRPPRLVTPLPSATSTTTETDSGPTERSTALERDRAVDGPALLALYSEAHRLHFLGHYAAALVAWDRYLAAGPGPLDLEARYNRAIALAHLGRRQEAIAALRPFADGELAGYRRQEALQLSDALRGDAQSQPPDP